MKRTKHVITRWLLKSAIGIMITAGAPFTIPWGVHAQPVSHTEVPSVPESFLKTPDLSNRVSGVSGDTILNSVSGDTILNSAEKRKLSMVSPESTPRELPESKVSPESKSQPERLRRLLANLPELLKQEGRSQEEMEAFAAMVQTFLGAKQFESVVVDAQKHKKPITLNHFATGLTNESSAAQEFSSGFYLPLHWDSAREILPYELTLHFAGPHTVTVEAHSPSAHSEHTIQLV